MDFSRITEGLLIGTTPRPRDYDLLSDLGVQLVINMRWTPSRLPGARSNPALQFLWLRTFDSPLLPIPMPTLVRGARRALDVMGHGGQVYVHCARGRHRSVAMGAAILIAQGLPPEHAMELIRARRAEADPAAPHIRRRIMLFAHQWGDQTVA